MLCSLQRLQSRVLPASSNFGGSRSPRSPHCLCPKWFVKFYAGDFSPDDVPHSGRPVEVDHDQIETLTKDNQHYTRQETDDIFEISNSSAKNHLH